MKYYIDKRGWTFFVATDTISGYKIYYCKPADHAKPTSYTVWHTERKEAEKDLDLLAKRKGWRLG